MQLFRYDSPISQLLVKFVNIIFLTVLWYAFCIPLVTIGASTGAFYHTIEKNIKNDRGYVFSDFFTSFKGNLRQSLPITIAFLAAEAVFYFDFIIMRYLMDNGNPAGNAYVLFLVLMVLILVYAIWIFISISAFENTSANIMKNSLLLMIRHFGVTLYILLMIGFAALVIYIVPVSFTVMPAVAAWLISFPVQKVYSKYQQAEETSGTEADEQSSEEKNEEKPENSCGG